MGCVGGRALWGALSVPPRPVPPPLPRDPSGECCLRGEGCSVDLCLLTAAAWQQPHGPRAPLRAGSHGGAAAFLRGTVRSVASRRGMALGVPGLIADRQAGQPRGLGGLLPWLLR